MSYQNLIEKNIPFGNKVYTTNIVENYPFTNVPDVKFEYNPVQDDMSFYRDMYNQEGIKDVYEKKRLTEKEVNLLVQRAKEQENIDFEQFVLKFLKPDDPYTLEVINKNFPEFIERRERTIEEFVTLLKRVTTIAVRGVKDKDDIALLYNIKEGKIKLPAGILSSIFNMGGGHVFGGEDPIVGRGIFNPLKYKRLESRPEYHIPSYPFPMTIGANGIEFKNKDGMPAIPIQDRMDVFNQSLHAHFN